jgi:hypothetical protein
MTSRVDSGQDNLFKKARTKSARQERIQITTNATAQESFTPNRSEGETRRQKVRHFTPNVGTSRLVVLKSCVPFDPADKQ